MWLIVAIVSYLILAAVALADKFFVAGPVGSARLYTFYIGILQIPILLLIPFVGLPAPGLDQIIIALLAGAFYMLGLFWFFRGLQEFEASRIVPAMGGMMPVLVFLLFFIISGDKALPKPIEFLAFFLLISGSFLVAYQRAASPIKGLKFSALAALFVALYFVLSKYVFLEQTFWQGFVWIRAGSFLAGIFFFFFARSDIKNAFSKKRKPFSIKMTLIFLGNQSLGASASILQIWAVALAPLVFVAMVSALQGVQYALLFIFALLLSLKFPTILKEEISKRVVFQKIIAILLIAAGLSILAVK